MYNIFLHMIEKWYSIIDFFLIHDMGFAKYKFFYKLPEVFTVLVRSSLTYILTWTSPSRGNLAETQHTDNCTSFWLSCVTGQFWAQTKYCWSQWVNSPLLLSPKSHGNCINFYAKFKVTKLWCLLTDTSCSSLATSFKKESCDAIKLLTLQNWFL